jgi:hypothetical protein
VALLALGITIPRSALAESENPKISPAPTEKEPLNFEGESKSKTETTLTQEGEKGVKHQIRCEKVKILSKSAFTSSETAKDVHLLFEGNCKLTTAPESKCKTEGTENGKMLLLVDLTLVDILPKEEALTLGVRMQVLNLKLESSAILITCGVANVEVKGAVIGEVTGVVSGEKTKTAELLFHEVGGGKQELRECTLLEKVCLDLPGKTHLKFELLAKFTAAEAFAEGRLATEDQVTFAQEVTLTDDDCVNLTNVIFTSENEAKAITIQNCSLIARADVVSVLTTNETLFTPAKTPCPVPFILTQLGMAGDKCTEKSLFRANVKLHRPKPNSKPKQIPEQRKLPVNSQAASGRPPLTR